MASVKWLDRIEVLDRPFDGFQQGRYLYLSKESGEAGTPVTTIRVKSLMVPPGLPDWHPVIAFSSVGPCNWLAGPGLGRGSLLRRSKSLLTASGVQQLWQRRSANTRGVDGASIGTQPPASTC